MAHDHLLDSGALQTLNKVLGATGGTQHTHIDSANLQLSLNANPFVRRGRTLAGSEGLFTFAFVNVHAGGDSVSLNVNPYAVTTPQNGFPTPIHEGLEVWVCNLFATATAANLQDVALPSWLGLVHTANKTAFGTAAVATQPLRMFGTQASTSGGLRHLLEQATLQATTPFIPQRVPRGSTLTWFSSATAATAGNLICRVTMGVFPGGLGQDLAQL